MQNRYKVILSNANVYKEIDLSPEMQLVRVGTGKECDVRLHKELFFEQFELRFTQKDGSWGVLCSDNLYLSVGDVRKLLTKGLAHGETLEVKYQGSDSTLFTLEYLIDFGSETIDYNRIIDVQEKEKVTIGKSQNDDIVINSPYINNDEIVISKTNTGYVLTTMSTTFGVFVNGKKANKQEKLSNGDFISVSDFFFCLKDGCLYTQKRDDMTFHSVNYHDLPDMGQYPKFNRNTRLKTVVCEDSIEILDPPAKQQKPKENLFMSLLPSMGMMLTSGAMMMTSQGSGSMILFSGVSAGMAVVTAVLGFVNNNKDHKQSLVKRVEEYNNYINRKKEEINKYRDIEKQQLEDIYWDSDKEIELVSHFSPGLFDRQMSDWDFLFVRLGNGRIESKRAIQHKKQEKLEADDELQLIPEQVKRDYEYLDEAPVVCDFKTANAVCISGPEEFRFSIFKNIILDICVRQFYSDVQIVVVCDESNKEKISSLRFLPHLNNIFPDMRNIVCDDESKNRIFDYLYKEFTQRQELGDNVVYNSHIVVFLYNEYGFKRHPISKFVNNASKLGVTFVFMTDEKEQSSVGCRFVINMQSHNMGRIIDTTNCDNYTDFQYNPVENEKIDAMVRLLAPVYTEEISLEGSLTKNISLFEMMNVLMVEDIDLKSRWQSSMVFKTMAAPIGVTKNGIVSLDLHDKAHGPHGLVAGTTGSGKSEILQTYILSMATLFHPYEVGFVIIDFKGGGMVNQFKNLPHLMGAITNIDGKEIDRSLKSIKAELKKRQRLFASAGVNHIDKYIMKFKSGEVTEPIPHLVLIVDEFAELKAEQPEFMKELISAARIGRSLGVHLILATQKPSGQVDDQIWSNSRFKLCLKVQSEEDSNEVLKSPLAAEIKEPGRAYLQVGNNEVFELFQSAYSGAPEKTSDTNVKDFTVYHVAESGKHTAVFSQKKKKSDNVSKTQLDAIVEHVEAYCKSEGINRLPNICLPPLPDRLLQKEMQLNSGAMVDIGLYDDPDNQIQAPAFLDFANKNTLIIGSAQFGKTNLLQTIIKSIALQTSPNQSVFYIMDFGSMILKNFEALNHVGGVVTSSEDEKIKNLFKLIFEEINKRKEKLLSVGVGSFSSYLEAGYSDLPHIYLVVDNFTALNELYLEDDDSFLSIIREGLSFGISTIVANGQVSGIGYKYLSNFANKVMMYCNDSNEYMSAFDHVAIKPDEKPGRCIVEIDKRLLECQSYLAFEGHKEIERIQQMKSFIQDVNKKYENTRAKQIPYIPNKLTVEELEENYNSKAHDSVLPIGLTYSDVKPFELDLSSLGVMGITGKSDFGHENIISVLIKSFMSDDMGSAEIVIFDDVSRKYSEYKDSVAYYTLETEKILDVINQWYDELERRYEQMMIGINTSEINKLLVLIVQNNDVAKMIQSDFDVLNKYNDMVSKYKNMGICVIFADYPNSSISYDAPDPIRMIKQDQHVICLDDLQNLKCFDPPYEAIREYRKQIVQGDGYYINENEVIKLKFVTSEY